MAEVYSPGQEGRGELVAKAGWYVQQGVELALLVDPERLTVIAFSAEGEAVFTSDDTLPLDAFLPGLRLSPGELIAALQP